jgi:tetratricopeptide (TPR) repeat protein
MKVNPEEIYSMLAQVENMPHGDSQIALAEEAVRLADLTLEEELQVEARMQLIKATTFGGEKEKSIVAYSWCLKKFDENPEKVDFHQLFWRYKWILGGLYDFPNISREKIDGIFADAIKRFQQHGISLRPIYGEICLFETLAGDYEKAKEYYYKWVTESVDRFADCYACEVNKQVECFSEIGSFEGAVSVAEPILKGKLKCAEVPHITYPLVLLPLLELEQTELASEYFTKGYKLVSKNKEFLPAISKMIEFLIFAGKIQKALSLFERHLNWAVETKNLERKFRFYRSSCLLLQTLETDQVKLNLSSNCQFFQESGLYSVQNLFESLASEAAKIAELFDRRNGNNKYKIQLFGNPLEVVPS